MMLYSTHTWDLVRALESTSPASCKTPAASVDSIRPNNHPRRNKRFWKKTTETFLAIEQWCKLGFHFRSLFSVIQYTFFTKVTPLCLFSPEYPGTRFALQSPPYKSIDNLEHVKIRKFRLMAIIIKWMQWGAKNITKYKVTCLESVTDCHYKQVAMMSHYGEKSL